MKIVLVEHTGTDSYRLQILKHRNLITLHSGPGIRNEVQVRAPAELGVGRSKPWVPEHIFPYMAKLNHFLQDNV